jgi:hypothetical protein
MLTTKVHLVNPRVVPINVTASIFLRGDADPTQVFDDAIADLARFIHPFQGGRDGNGWPFGQSLFASEVYWRLAQLDAVDYVEGVQLNAWRTQPDGTLVSTRVIFDGTNPIGVDVADSEVLLLDGATTNRTASTLTLLTFQGGAWQAILP